MTNPSKNPSQADINPPLVDQDLLDKLTAMVGPQQQMVTLFEYVKQKLANGEEPDRAGINAHFADFIVARDGEVSLMDLKKLNRIITESGLGFRVEGVHQRGNRFQQVTGYVHGINDRSSGYERPMLKESPHMVIVPYAYDENGDLHIFRTLQYRTGEVVVDTPRGFAKQKEGSERYEVEGAASQINKNLARILKEEGGDRFLSIKNIEFLGAPRANTTCIESRSAIFAVEIDYNQFIQANDVVSYDELTRQRDQFDHEGLLGKYLDFTLKDYLTYKQSPGISKDIVADCPSDTIVMRELFRRQQEAQEKVAILKQTLATHLEALEILKETSPEAYAAYQAASAK